MISAYIGTSTSTVPPSCQCGSGPQNLDMVRGDTGVFNILLYTPPGAPLNISGGTLAFNAQSGLPIASMNLVPTPTVPVSGQAVLTIPTTNTSSLANVRWTFNYQLVYTDLFGNVTTVAYGTLTLWPNQ